MYIDTNYAVRSNMISQTGGAISKGHGGVAQKLLVQTLNKKSSAEAELVGMSEYLPCNVWPIDFFLGRDM